MLCLLFNFSLNQHEFDMCNGTLAWESMCMGLKDYMKILVVNYSGGASYSFGWHCECFRLFFKLTKLIKLTNLFALRNK